VLPAAGPGGSGALPLPSPPAVRWPPPGGRPKGRDLGGGEDGAAPRAWLPLSPSWGTPETTSTGCVRRRSRHFRHGTTTPNSAAADRTRD